MKPELFAYLYFVHQLAPLSFRHSKIKGNVWAGEMSEGKNVRGWQAQERKCPSSTAITAEQRTSEPGKSCASGYCISANELSISPTCHLLSKVRRRFHEEQDVQFRWTATADGKTYKARHSAKLLDLSPLRQTYIRRCDCPPRQFEFIVSNSQTATSAFHKVSVTTV